MQIVYLTNHSTGLAGRWLFQAEHRTQPINSMLGRRKKQMPKASKNEALQLAQLSSDCSFLLTHLIRQPADKARLVLNAILGLESKTPMLKAGEVGWYSVSTPNVFDVRTCSFSTGQRTKAVCFTESTLAGLKAHRDVFNISYGLAFDRDFLFLRGANPCLNIREDIFRRKIQYKNNNYDSALYNFVPVELHPFINVINESFDATHEREWRLAEDLAFELNNVLFIFCPEKDFEYFSKVQNKGRPVLFDLQWLNRI